MSTLETITKDSSLAIDTFTFDLDSKNKLKILIGVLLQKLPKFASVLLRLSYRFSETSPNIAATDGVTIIVNKDFLELKRNDQLFILLHEAIHVVLQHPKRFKDFKLQGCTNHRLLNVCCDLLINESICTLQGIQKPEFVIFYDSLQKEGLLKDYTRQEVLKLSVPELYKLLYKEIPKVNIYLSSIGAEGDSDGDSEQDSNSSDNTSNPKSTKSGKSGNKTKNGSDKLTGSMIGDIKPYASNKESKEVLEKQAAESDGIPLEIKEAQLLKELQKVAGSCNSEMLLNLLEVKPPLLNWRRILRSSILKYAKTKYDHINKPNKRMGEYLGKRNPTRSIPFIRKLGTLPDKPVIIIALDVSGSIYCDDELLSVFFTELESLRKTLHCDLRILSFQSSVTGDDFIPYDLEPLFEKVKSNKLEIKGGGGTDFVPVLNLCKEDKNVKLIIFLTDLYGNWGNKEDYKKLDVIWILSPDHSSSKPDFGKFAIIDDI